MHPVKGSLAPAIRRYPGGMRGIVVLALLALVFGAGLARAAGSTAHTTLAITYWPNGQQDGDREVWTLRCNPARGTHPRPAVACRRLQAGGQRLMAPVPAGAICTEIYGGPQVVLVKGVLQGNRVWARFTRVNGCQIARWSRLSPWLIPAGGVTG